MPCVNQERNQNNYDRRLRKLEAEAYGKYKDAALELNPEALPQWFVRLLKNRIVPDLKRVGFIESFCWSIFQIASSAWVQMGFVGEGRIWFHPRLIWDMEEVRKGILFQSDRLFQKKTFIFNTPSRALRLSVDKMFPENLLSGSDDIYLSWIILPRVFDHLEKSHSQYLPGYLKYLNTEPIDDFKRVLVRITIEFVGNFVFKFRSDIHAADRIIDALFYGYEAMFWKNLRNPPAGLEGIPIFDYFLSWARRFQNKFAAGQAKKINRLKKMAHEKVKVFPDPNAFGLAPFCRNDMNALLISLRHGHLGIESAIRSFGIGKALLKNKTDGLLAYLEVPAALSAFFRKIQQGFKTESPTTQAFIKMFLAELCASYELKRTPPGVVDKRFLDQLRFVRPRILKMTNDLARTLEQ